MEKEKDREDTELAKTVALWVMGIIMFLIILIYDNRRISVDEKAKELIRGRVELYAAKMAIDIEQNKFYIEVIRTQLSQVEPKFIIPEK